MKRRITKWLIDLAIDDNRPFSNWVTKQLQNDYRLAEYARQQQRLADRLGSDANEWVQLSASQSRSQSEIQTARPIIQTSETRSSKITWTALATAAVLVLGAVIAFNRTSETPTPDPIATNDTIEHNDASQNDQKQSGAAKVWDLLSKGEKTFDKLAADYQTAAANKFPLPVKRPKELSRITSQYVERAGTVYGRGLSMLTQ